MDRLDVSVSFVTVDRPEGYLHATLESFGRDRPATLMVGSTEAAYLDRYRGDAGLRIVVPTAEQFEGWAERGVSQRACWNLSRRLADARGRRILICEDDVVFARGWWDFLEKVVAEIERTETDYLLTLYRPGTLGEATGSGLFAFDPGSFWGTQAVLYAGRAVEGFTEHLRRHGVDEWVRPQDINLGHYAREAQVPFYSTCPSLVQHIGQVTTGQGWYHRSATFVPDLTGPVGASLSWDRIPGCFDLGPFYAEVVRDARPGARLVEVGCGRGRSVASLGGDVSRSGKPIEVFAVEDGIRGDSLPNPDRVTIAPELVRNLFECGLHSVVTPIIASSVRAARVFADGSLDMVFLHAAQSYDDARDDLRAWWPKIRPGGLIAGHHDDRAGVTRAVDEFFGRKHLVDAACPTCWAVARSGDSPASG